MKGLDNDSYLCITLSVSDWGNDQWILLKFIYLQLFCRNVFHKKGLRLLLDGLCFKFSCHVHFNVHSCRAGEQCHGHGLDSQKTKVHVQTFEVSKILFERNCFQQGCIELVKSDRKDIYQIKYFFFSFSMHHGFCNNIKEHDIISMTLSTWLTPVGVWNVRFYCIFDQINADLVSITEKKP